MPLAEKFITDKSGVSKVVGVILMIGITVVLVAVVGTMTSSMADNSPSQNAVEVQQSAFSIRVERNETYSPPYLNNNCGSDGSCLAGPNDAYVADILTVTYEGGSPLPAEEIRVRVDGVETKYIDDAGYLRDRGSGNYHSNYTLASVSEVDSMSAGDQFRIVTNYGDYAAPNPPNPGGLLRDGSVDIIYESDDESVIVAEWDGS